MKFTCHPTLPAGPKCRERHGPEDSEPLKPYWRIPSSSSVSVILRRTPHPPSRRCRRRRRRVEMKAIWGGGEWWWNLPSLRRRKADPRRRGRRNPDPRGRRRGPPPEPLSSSSESISHTRGWNIDFPFRQAAIAASLTLTGDTIAQVRSRIVDRRLRSPEPDNKGLIPDILMNHDWLRGLRIASYGFLLYGPGSHAWYQFLDQCMPKPTFANLSTKVILNQIVLGPCVIGIIFAWNNLWLRKLSELPSKYQKDALPTLLFGFRFWIPVSIVNFWMVPLSARVAFMSTCSIFWNFYLSTTMNK